MEEEGTKKKDKYAQEKGQICSRKRRNISKKEDKCVLETLPEAQRTQKLTPRLGLNLATTWRHLQIWPPDGAT